MKAPFRKVVSTKPAWKTKRGAKVIWLVLECGDEILGLAGAPNVRRKCWFCAGLRLAPAPATKEDHDG